MDLGNKAARSGSLNVNNNEVNEWNYNDNNANDNLFAGAARNFCFPKKASSRRSWGRFLLNTLDPSAEHPADFIKLLLKQQAATRSQLPLPS